MISNRRNLYIALGFALFGTVGIVGSQEPKSSAVGWPTHGGNAQHSATSSVKAQDLKRILWSTPLDLQPQYNGDVLYAHYGSPVITADNVVILPVKTGATDSFRIEARNGATGALLWTELTDYSVPSHNWFPTLGPTITGASAAWARKAGLVAFHDLKSGKSDGPATVCFYGMENYLANPAAYDAAVKISSPIVTGEDGSLYFSYQVSGETPIGLKSGIAVVRRRGLSSFVSGADASGNPNYVRPKLNAAPAVFKNILYAVLKSAGGSDGVIVGLDARTLQPKYEAALIDPKTGQNSYVDDDGTACPTVGPDGDVYYGVLESPFGSHHYRGWLLHFNSSLTVSKIPGGFGWDDAASIVPKEMLPEYKGRSSYLVMTKYNNYAGQGDGINRIAVLDPNESYPEPISGLRTMREVVSKVGPTPDLQYRATYHNAVREWCINTAAVDVKGKSIIVNNEDGIVYRWNLITNALDQKVQITDGIGQAYTPTLIGPTGVSFAVSNARLFAIGK